MLNSLEPLLALNDDIADDVETQPASAALLESIKMRDQDAMRALYFEYAPSLQSFIGRCLSNAKDLSDALHDTMMTIWKTCHDYHSGQSIKVWMFSIARSITHRYNDKITSGLTAGDRVSQNDTCENGALLDHFGQLHPDYRSVLYLIFSQNLSYADVARIENCPLEIVKERFLMGKLDMAKQTG